MQRLHGNGYDQIDNLKLSLALLGFWLTPSCRVLDFGCGGGSLVYAFRDLGYDAQGFDIHDYVQYRDESDRSNFRFFDTGHADASNTQYDSNQYRLPFDTDSFDLIVSTTVFEHTMNRKAVFSELSRIVKPTGVNYHVYPGIEQIIEPHMYVPFATRLQSLQWFRFWAKVGIRNEHQEGKSPEEVAQLNFNYSQRGLNYMTFRQAQADAREFFSSVVEASREHNHGRTTKSVLRRLPDALRAKYPLRALSVLQRMTALAMYNKIAT